MRIVIDTDLDEFGPQFATIDVCWEDPPPSVKVRWVPSPQSVMLNLILLQIPVDMQDGDDPGGVKAWPYDAA
jgi:hypothetical protein